MVGIDTPVSVARCHSWATQMQPMDLGGLSPVQAEGELSQELLCPTFLAVLPSMEVGPGLGSSPEEARTWVHILHSAVLLLLSEWRP